MSRIRANQITNQAADGAPVVQNGLVVTGVVTSTTFSGTFSGDGSALVGVASTDNIQTGTAATFTSTVDISDGTLIIPSGDTASRTGINTSTGDFRYNLSLIHI